MFICFFKSGDLNFVKVWVEDLMHVRLDWSKLEHLWNCSFYKVNLGKGQFRGFPQVPEVKMQFTA